MAVLNIDTVYYARIPIYCVVISLYEYQQPFY